MDLVAGIIIYVILWWVIFFMTLPFGGHMNPTPKKGHDTGAPKVTYLREKIVITTLISTTIWFGVEYLISINLIDFRELGRAM